VRFLETLDDPCVGGNAVCAPFAFDHNRHSSAGMTASISLQPLFAQRQLWASRASRFDEGCLSGDQAGSARAFFA
jgi:hypothetical protein